MHNRWICTLTVRMGKNRGLWLTLQALPTDLPISSKTCSVRNYSDTDGDGLLDSDEVLVKPYIDPTKYDSDEVGTNDKDDDTPQVVSTKNFRMTPIHIHYLMIGW